MPQPTSATDIAPLAGNPNKVGSLTISRKDGLEQSGNTIIFNRDDEFLTLPSRFEGENLTKDSASKLLNDGVIKPFGRYETREGAIIGAEDRTLSENIDAAGLAEGVTPDQLGGLIPMESLLDPRKYLTTLPFGTIDSELAIGPDIIGPARKSGIRTSAMSVATDEGWRNWQKLFSAFGDDGQFINGTRKLDESEYNVRMGVLAEKYPWRQGIIEAEMEHNIVEAKLTAWEKAVSSDRSWLDKGATATAAFILHGITTPEVGGAIVAGILAGKLAGMVGLGVQIGAMAIVGRPVLSGIVAKTGTKALSRPMMLIAESAGDIAFVSVYESGIAFQERRELSVEELSLYTAFPIAIAARNMKVAVSDVLEARRLLREETLRSHDSAETLVRIVADSLGEEITEDSVREIVPTIVDVLRRTGGKLTDDDLKAVPSLKQGSKADVRIVVNNEPAQVIANAMGEPNFVKRLAVEVDNVMADIGFPDIVAKALYRISQTGDETLVRAVTQGLLDSGLVSRTAGNIEGVVKAAADDYATLVNTAIRDSVGDVAGIGISQKLDINAGGLGFIRSHMDNMDLRYGTEPKPPGVQDVFSTFAQKTGINSIAGISPESAKMVSETFERLSTLSQRMPEIIKETVQSEADNLVARLKKFVELSRTCLDG